MLECLVFFVLAVLGFLVNLEKALELEHRTSNAEAVNLVAVLRINVHGRLVEDRRVHLRGHKALPDELVNLIFVFLQILPDRVRMTKRRTGPNGLVRVLRVLLRLVRVRRLGQELRAVSARDQFAYFGQRFIRDTGRIRTHVGDESDRALVAEIDAFVEALRDDHGALYAEAQLARRVLLKLAGSERRGRAAPSLALVNRADAPVGELQRGLQLAGFLAIRDCRLLVADTDKPRRKCGRLGSLQVRVDGPIFLLNERLDVALTLDDEPQRNRLHAACGEPAADFVPQQRRNLIANQAVEHAAGLLRVHQVAVDIAGMLEGILHSALGDLVKGDPADVHRPFFPLLAIHRLAAEFLGQVSGNGFAFAVRVRGKIDGVRRLRQLLQLGDDLLLARDDHVLGGEIVVEIDPERLLGQVFDMAEARLPPRSPRLDIFGSSSPWSAIRR